MKRYAFSMLAIALASAALAPVANASGQTSLRNLSADRNGDGVVTLVELKYHNMESRQS